VSVLTTLSRNLPFCSFRESWVGPYAFLSPLNVLSVWATFLDRRSAGVFCALRESAFEAVCLGDGFSSLHRGSLPLDVWDLRRPPLSCFSIVKAIPTLFAPSLRAARAHPPLGVVLGRFGVTHHPFPSFSASACFAWDSPAGVSSRLCSWAPPFVAHSSPCAYRRHRHLSQFYRIGMRIPPPGYAFE